MAVAVKITEKTIRALRIVRDFAKRQESKGRKWPWSGISASWFGDEMWPDSPAKMRSYNIGAHGATRGKGLWLCAGSYLRKLEARGLVSSEMGRYYDGTYSYTYHWHLTEEGKAVLKEEKAKGRVKGKRQAKGRKRTPNAKA